jgi:hypothetical protein
VGDRDRCRSARSETGPRPTRARTDLLAEQKPQGSRLNGWRVGKALEAADKLDGIDLDARWKVELNW